MFGTGIFTYTVHIRSDSYLGVDIQEDIKLDVKEARKIVTEHPQWKFEEEEDDDSDGQGSEDDSDFATDDDDDDEN